MRLFQEGMTRHKPPMDYPPWPCFDEADIAAVAAVLRSGHVNRWTGHENELFEQEFAQFAGCRYAVAVANGTFALELAIRSLGIGPGDEVIVPSRTFIATASAVVMCGAVPVIVDVDPNSQNLTAATVAPHVNRKTKAIIAVHLAGWPCEMTPLQQLAKEHHLFIIEDCAQAHGATYRQRPVGSLGDVAAFSFCHDKIMTTGGEGGMLTTNSEEIWRRAWSFKDHGKNFEAAHQKGAGSTFRWLHETFGTNGRMTELQAAIGRMALRKLPSWLEARQRNAALLSSSLEHVPGLQIVEPPGHLTHAYYKYYMFVRAEQISPEKGRDWILSEINKAGVPCFSGSCSEIYLEKAFVTAGLGPVQRLPVARRLGETSLMLPVHPTLTLPHFKKTLSVVLKTLNIAAQTGKE